jgi:hypothetical protein
VLDVSNWFEDIIAMQCPYKLFTAECVRGASERPCKAGSLVGVKVDAKIVTELGRWHYLLSRCIGVDA